MKFRLSTLMGAAAALALSTGLALAGPGEPGHSHKAFAAGEPGDPKKPVAKTIEVTLSFTFVGDGLRDALDPRDQI